MTTTIKLNVTKEGKYWVGLPDGYPGSCSGRSITELLQEAQAILPFMACGSDGKPVTDIVVDCVFTGLPAELQVDLRNYHELVEERRNLDKKVSDLAARTVKSLRSIAGLTDQDTAALLGISRQRVNQLRHA